MNNETRCDAQLWRGDDWHGSYITCGKPVKRRGLCGVHANMADRQAAEKHKADENAELATQLTRSLGVRVTYRSNGTFVINRAEAEAFVRANRG